MKKFIPLSAFAILLILAACSQPNREATAKLIADPKFRAEAIHEILGNEDYLSEFADKMIERRKVASVIYKMNPAVVKEVWESEKMDSLIDADGTVMQKMIKRVIHKMDNDTNSARTVFERFIENERFKAYVIRYQYGKQKPLKSRN